jgi:hypothetical protein
VSTKASQQLLVANVRCVAAHKQAYEKLLQSSLGERIAQAGLDVALRVTVQAAPVPPALDRVGHSAHIQPCSTV